MPILYRIDPTNKLVLTTVTGELTIADVLDHIERTDQDIDAQACNKELADLTNVTKIQFSFEIVKKVIAASRANEHLWPSDYRLAIVTNRNLVFAAARMFEMLTTVVTWRIDVFRTMEDARAWLGLDSQDTREEVHDSKN